MTTRIDELDPLPYTEEIPSLMSAWGRVDVHTIVAKFLSDNKVTGVYLEFGVGKGRSAVSAYRAYSREKICDRFYLFDSFCGLPELKGVDNKSIQFSEGDFSFTQEEVEVFLLKHQVSVNSFSFLHGWIEQSFPQWATANPAVNAAVIHIDIDLYNSCVSILSKLANFLQNGTIILFDDWNCFKASSKHGERRAVSEWLKANTNIVLHPYCGYGWHGQAFITEIY